MESRLATTIAHTIGLCLLATILVTAPPAFGADENKQRIIILETMTLPLLQQGTKWFKQELATLGVQEGENVEFEVLNAQGSIERAEELLSEALKERQTDLVVTIATLASRAGRELLRNQETPQLFMFVADPVKENFVPGIGRTSESNITGITHVIPASAKIEIIADTLLADEQESALRIGVLHSSYPSSSGDAHAIEAAAKPHDRIAIKKIGFPYHPGETGMQIMREATKELLKENSNNVDLLWLTVGPNVNDPAFLDMVFASEIPVVYAGNIEAVKKGALLGMISNPEVNGTALARVATAVLGGKPANEIPVTRPDRFQVGVNLSTAQRIGAVFPSHLIELAGEHIYR